MLPSTVQGLLRIGCAGWSLRSDQQVLFPAGDSHLHRYSTVFEAVEVNSCFYRAHKKSTWKRWAESTPESFRFSYKLPKLITHQKRLRDAREPLCEFLEEVACLGSRQGTLLVQLPPSFNFDPHIITEFFLLLRDLDEKRNIHRYIACEPRHASWFTPEADNLLKELKVAGVAAHPPRLHQGFAPFGFSGHAYYRMHGAPRIYYSPYSETELQTLASRVASSVAAGIESWCIFDNTAEGHALSNALRFSENFQHGI